MIIRLVIAFSFDGRADAWPGTCASRSLTGISGLHLSHPLWLGCDDTQATLPEVKRNQIAKAKTDDEKKEIACVQIPISARV